MKIYKLECEYKSLISDSLLNLVTEERRERVKRQKEKSKAFIILFSELLIRYVIKKELKIENNKINFKYNKYGKPYLKGYEDFFFNITHSKNIILCATSNKEIGLDIEYIKERDLNNRTFSEEEKEYILSSSNKLKAFYEIWTLKESFSKFIGEGLNIPKFNIFSLKGYNFNTFYFKNYVASICNLEKEKIEFIDIKEEEILNSFKEEYYV